MSRDCKTRGGATRKIVPVSGCVPLVESSPAGPLVAQSSGPHSSRGDQLAGVKRGERAERKGESRGRGRVERESRDRVGRESRERE